MGYEEAAYWIEGKILAQMRRRNRVVMALFVAAVLVAVWMAFDSLNRKQPLVRMTGGDPLGRRAQIASKLAGQAEEAGLSVLLEPTAGSEAALAMVAQRKLDAALIQGGSKPHPDVRLLAALYTEPLHLLVKPGLEEGGFAALRGKRMNLSIPGSGTHRLAQNVLAFAGLQPGRDFSADTLNYDQLRKAPMESMPDGIFMVSSMPSGLAELLVRERGYRLKEIPFAGAMSFRDFTVRETRIPAFTYSAEPAVPPRDIATVGNMLLLVAHREVPRAVGLKLLGAVFDPEFARAAEIRGLSSAEFDANAEFPLHEGAVAFRDRQKPLITTEMIDGLENTRSLIVSTLVAMFFFWQWYSRRQNIGFEKYMVDVTAIERQILELEMQPELNLEELVRQRQRLTFMKNEALEKFAAGSIKGEELMSSFLAHVMDVRNYADTLILHERERLEKEARASSTGSSPQVRIDELWKEALGEFAEEGRE